MNPRLLIGVVIALAVTGVSLWLLRPNPEYERAYVRGRNVTAWNRLAPVREPVVNLRYGERVSVVEHQRGNVQIQTTNGERGWVDERHLMAEDLWVLSEQLRARATKLGPYAVGKTKVTSNLRIQPGRDTPRIYQLAGQVPVQIVAREVVEWQQNPAAGQKAPSRREDWYLVRARQDDVGDLAGWLLGRFVEPDLPEPMRQLGAGVRWMAWNELDRVADGEDQKTQFLGLGQIGPEGQSCDFTLLRVYTWHLARHRYETAYVESNLCGSLPVRLLRPGNEIVFTFRNVAARGEEQREYRFRQNILRRVRGGQ